MYVRICELYPWYFVAWEYHPPLFSLHYTNTLSLLFRSTHIHFTSLSLKDQSASSPLLQEFLCGVADQSPLPSALWVQQHLDHGVRLLPAYHLPTGVCVCVSEGETKRERVRHKKRWRVGSGVPLLSHPLIPCHT